MKEIPKQKATSLMKFDEAMIRGWICNGGYQLTNYWV